MLTTPIARRPFLKLAAAGATLIASPGILRAQEKLKIGFIYVGPVGDFGWTYSMTRAARRSRRLMATRSRRPSSRACRRPIRARHRGPRSCRLQADLHHLLRLHGCDAQVAAKYPDVKFEHATGFKQAENVATYSAKFHEGRHVVGLIAGKMTKTNKIGMSGLSRSLKSSPASTRPSSRRSRSIRPQKMKVVWANTWFDPAKEADAAKVLLDQGVDIMTQHTDSPAPLQAAAERGFFGVGQASDMTKIRAREDPHLDHRHWAPYYIKAHRRSARRNLEERQQLLRMAVDEVVMGAFTNMPDDVKKLAEQAVADIKAGKINGFTCRSRSRMAAMSPARAAPCSPMPDRRHELLRRRHHRKVARP